MKKNNNLNKNFIEINDLIEGIWRDKLLVLILVSILGILGFSYGNYKLKIFETQSKTKLLSKKDFYSVSFIEDYSNTKILDQLHNEFNNEFNITLLSSENIDNFFKKNKSKNLKSNWISLKNTTKESEKGYYNVYSLVFKKPFQAQKILNDYMLFTFNKLEQKFKLEMSTLVSNSIQKYKNHLKYAIKTNIEVPVENSFQVNKNNSTNLFFQGSIILTEELKYLKKELSKIQNFSFDKQIFLQKPSTPTMISKNGFFFTVVAIVIGIFISLFTVLSRLILFKK